MKLNRNKNTILLAVACVALLGAGYSLYLQFAPEAPAAPAPAQPEAAAPAGPGDEVALEDEGDPEWQEEEPGMRSRGGFAFPPGYDGPLEGTEANPPEPEE